MGALVLLFFLGVFLVALPLMFVMLLIRLAFGVALLPFRLAGALLHVAGKLVGLVAHLAFGLVGLVVGIGALVLSVFLLPLLPFLLLGGLVWLVIGAMRPRAALVRP
jgi:hypothetical protein